MILKLQQLSDHAQAPDTDIIFTRFVLDAYVEGWVCSISATSGGAYFETYMQTGVPFVRTMPGYRLVARCLRYTGSRWTGHV
jgi:hypothetical protein